MADESKKDVKAAKTETEQAAEASAKVAKAAKKNPSKAKKSGPSAGSKLKQYFIDVRGETKKVIWPDAKTVFKSTGVVILVVVICALIIWGIDMGLTSGVSGLKSLANPTTEASETVEDESTDAEAEEETEADAETSEESSEETSEEESEASSEEAASETEDTQSAE